MTNVYIHTTKVAPICCLLFHCQQIFERARWQTMPQMTTSCHLFKNPVGVVVGLLLVLPELAKIIIGVLVILPFFVNNKNRLLHREMCCCGRRYDVKKEVQGIIVINALLYSVSIQFSWIVICYWIIIQDCHLGPGNARSSTQCFVTVFLRDEFST